MPVRIKKGDASSDPRVISLEEYNQGRHQFKEHYFYTAAESEFGGQNIDANWDDLQNAVANYITATGTPDSEVALRFVHCFDSIPGDPTPGHLYMKMQICKMVLSAETPPPGMSQVYNLDTTGAMWYEIKNNVFTLIPGGSLDNTDYLDNFYYKPDPAGAGIEQLAAMPNKFVTNLVLPWQQEVQLMYLENNSPIGAGVHFAACTYHQPMPHYSNVYWPHGMVIYLSDSQGNCLNNHDDVICMFHNKGADLATLCPPRCNVYIAPNL